MWDRRLWLLSCALIAIGCVKPTAFTKCGEFTCGIGAICSPDGTQCVAPETVYACDGLGDGDRCTYTGVSDGVCTGSICVPGGCGNGMLETALGEVCDDGNFVSGDGCRADCKSMEVCGDGIRDIAAGEICDCGDGTGPVPADCNGPNADTANATCRPVTCTLGRCGDGILDAPLERCDDHNNAPGDGCAADCSGRWTPMDAGTVATLRDVDATSTTNAWAVGTKKILRYDGQTWEPIGLPPGTSAFEFTGVHIAASGDVFVVGHNPANVTAAGVYRYHAGAWATVTFDTNAGWVAIAGSGPDIYIVGYTGTTYGMRIAKYNATTTTFNNENNAAYTDGHLWKVAVAPGGTAYATDIDVPAEVYCYVSGAGGWSICPGTSPATLVSAPVANQLFQFYPDAGGSVSNGTSSTPITNSSQLLELNDSDALAGLAMVVGGLGSAMICTPTSCSITATHTLTKLLGVKMIDDKHAFIVGEAGTILY